MAQEALAQNLFPNPGFEEYSSCPDKLGQTKRCKGWDIWVWNTTDYYNCGYYEQYFTGYPFAKPHLGTGVMGFSNTSNDTSLGTYTEGIIAPLVLPVKAGHNYRLRFHLAIASMGIAVKPTFGQELAFGFYFYNKNTRPQWNGPGGPFDWKRNSFIPQFSVTASSIDTYDRYKEFTFCFTPASDYDSVYVGGVSTPFTGSLPSKDYYFNLDDIELLEQPDTLLLATVSADSICTATCIHIEISYTAHLDDLSFEASGASYALPARLPLRLCYDSAGQFPLSLLLHRNGSCAAFRWQDTIVVTDPIHLQLPDSILCPGQSLIVDLHSYPASHLRWNDGDTAHLKTFDVAGQYSLILQTRGCNSSTAFTLGIRDQCIAEVMVPTAFSPNGDGLNDLFRVISNYPLPNFSIRIYNRWGQSIFYRTNYQAGWDGGSADVGTYFYQISYDHPLTHVPVRIKGDVSLVR